MKVIKIIQRLVDEANLKVQQQCGLRPFRITYNPLNLFHNEDWWKAYFGFALSPDRTIKQKDGTHLMLPAWKYHKIKSGYDGVVTVNVLKYFEE